jgi:outer membrane protein OmpA-like peptidoglycan-associated protein
MDGGEPQPGKNGPQEWVYHVAAQLASTELPSRTGATPPRRPRRWIVPVAVGAVVALGGLVFALSRDGDDEVETGADTTVATAAVSTLASIAESSVAPTSVVVVATTEPPGPPSTSGVATTAGPTTTAPATSTTAPATTAAPSAIDPAAPPVRYAEFSDGVVTLAGRVPDQATADEIAAKAGAVVGPDNVRVEYVIDPTAPKPDFAPLYVNNSILFAPGLSLLNQEARETLDLGVSLLTLFPAVTFDIEGHTDSDGTDESNLALSLRRVEAIVDYLVERGVDPSRLTSAAKGEAEPIADNATPEGRARNRRIEIQVNNLLG